MRTKKTIYKYKDLELDSKDEMNFCYWLDELKKEGYIIAWTRADSITMSYGWTHNYKQGKKEKNQVILRPSEYTPDFRILWSKRAEDKLYQETTTDKKITAPFLAKSMISIVEIKPGGYDPHNMTRLFVLNQKFLWERVGIFVNLISYEELFRKTFTPQDVKIPITRATKKEKWKRHSLNQYLTSLK